MFFLSASQVWLYTSEYGYMRVYLYYSCLGDFGVFTQSQKLENCSILKWKPSWILGWSIRRGVGISTPHAGHFTCSQVMERKLWFYECLVLAFCYLDWHIARVHGQIAMSTIPVDINLLRNVSSCVWKCINCICVPFGTFGPQQRYLHYTISGVSDWIHSAVWQQL